MNHLLRSLAPITESGWELLDTEARDRLTAALAARKLVDFNGPRGWEHSATNLGRSAEVATAPCESVTAIQRRVLPLVELRADFAVSRAELRDHSRGALDVDLEALDKAARQMRSPRTWPCSTAGRTPRSPASWKSRPTRRCRSARTPRPIRGQSRTASSCCSAAASAGPTAWPWGRTSHARGPDGRARRYPLLDHLHKILEGPIVWAPGVKGAVVLSLRGGDFLFESGQDLAIGYDRHDADEVHLYLEESFSFVVTTGEAAAPLGP